MESSRWAGTLACDGPEDELGAVLAPWRTPGGPTAVAIERFGGRSAEEGAEAPSPPTRARSGRHVRKPTVTVGALRWLGSSSGKRPEDQVGAGTPDRGARAIARTLARGAARRDDFRKSPLRAWEAAVTHGRSVATPRASSRASASVGASTSVGASASANASVRVGREEARQGDLGVEANGRLTAMLGAALLILLAVEGLTILQITPLLTVHVVIGMVLVPVIALKIGSASWRFARYYLGSPAYRRKGPPPPLLRLLGPFVVVTTLAVFVTGIALLLVPHDQGLRGELLTVHQVTFVLWFAAMVVHVLGHLVDVARLAPRDFLRRTRRQIKGANLRQWVIVSALCVGVVLGVLLAPRVGPWLSGPGSGSTSTSSARVHVGSAMGMDRAQRGYGGALARAQQHGAAQSHGR